MEDTKKLLRELKYEQGIIRKVAVTDEKHAEYKAIKKEKKQLPTNVYYDRSSDTFYSYSENEMSEQEQRILLELKRTSYLRTIKNILTFFLVASIIGGVICLIIANL